MVPRWLMALLVLLQEAWPARRDAQILFLKLQLEMLQSRLPGNRIIADPVERRRLMKIGAEMRHAVEHTLGIVSIKTYSRCSSITIIEGRDPAGGSGAERHSGPRPGGPRQVCSHLPLTSG